MPRSELTVSVIIPTMNRPRDLERCVRSILAQRELPKQVVIVDDGEANASILRGWFERSPVELVYVKKDPMERGLCRSRNVGIRHSSGEIIVFLDDDTELDPGYLEAYLNVFEDDPAGEIGGASGAPTRFRNGVPLPPDHEVNWEVRLRRFFLLASSRGGRVLASGFRTSMLRPKGVEPVEFLQGGNMALRRRVFDTFSFDETLDRFGGYGLGEDVMFSYPVGRKFRLVSVEGARLNHYHTAGGRPDRSTMGRMLVVHQYRFLREIMRGRFRNYLGFAWAMTGLVIIEGLFLALRPDLDRWDRFRGVVSGIAEIVLRPRASLKRPESRAPSRASR